jgi:hypothetical protein
MSQENVERVRQVGEAWARGDTEAAETLLQGHIAPDFELHPLYLGHVYRGLEGMRELLADIFASGRTTASSPRRSSIWASTCLCWHMSRGGGLAAACRSISRLPCSALSRARRPFGQGPSRPKRRPSKPWGCANKRQGASRATDRAGHSRRTGPRLAAQGTSEPPPHPG